MKRVEFKLGDKIVAGTLVDFETLREEYNSYKLADGSTIRMKTVVTNIIRTEESTNPSPTSSIHKTCWWLSSPTNLRNPDRHSDDLAGAVRIGSLTSLPCGASVKLFRGDVLC